MRKFLRLSTCGEGFGLNMGPHWGFYIVTILRQNAAIFLLGVKPLTDWNEFALPRMSIGIRI